MKGLIRIAAATALMLGASPAFAQYVDGTEDNTDAGTTVTNEVTVSYEVGGVAQTAEVDDVAFVVDRVVLVTVASNGGQSVAPGASGQALAFTVTNDSNAALDFVLAASNGSTDDFNADSVQLRLESGATAGYQSAEDLVVTGSRLTALAEDASVTIYIVGDIPATGLVDNDTADMVLLATAYELAGDGGGIVAETNVGVDDDPLVVDTVFGDGDGDVDADMDGAHSDTGTFTVASATITVTKSSSVISDPFNGTTSPKAIPGAVVEYCILITNAGGTAATNVAVSDPVPDNTTYVAGSIQIADDCAGTNALAEDDDTDDNTPVAGDETGSSGSFDAGTGTNGTVNTQVGTLDDGDPTPTTTATLFRVTID